MEPTRRGFLKGTVRAASAAGVFGVLGGDVSVGAEQCSKDAKSGGAQRLSVAQLQKWESLGYGMFIHFGMSTYVVYELPEGNDPASVYAPDRLDVDQWVSVARDAGMRYAVLTTKHVAGHCLWPSKHTDYTVANSGNTTDVVEKFVTACRAKGVLPGFYYCSWDNHHRYGSWTPTDRKKEMRYDHNGEKLKAYTTSIYQNFQTAQIMELLETYGPIMEMWIDIPVVLGRGYRTYLYNQIAERWPETVIMMNTGIQDGATYPVDKAWPSDLMAIERRMPCAGGYEKWRTIEEKEYYLPGEICDPIGKNWFYEPNDPPRADGELIEQYNSARQRGVNLLLNVPPDTHGVIPEEHIQALGRVRKQINI